jgi:hypothetical protein
MLKTSLKVLVSSAVTIAAALALGAPVYADPDSLEGSWSGGGQVTFASGDKERAKCKATFSRSSATSYRVNGTCATQSGKVTQNSEVFNGTIAIVVNGRNMTATLTSTSGTGVLNLRH